MSKFFKEWEAVIKSTFKRVPLTSLPMADCPNCQHMENPEDGHCYMFRERPSERCGQFTPKGEQQS